MTSVAILSTGRATEQARAHVPQWAPGAVALGALGYAVVAQGAFYDGPRRAFTLALLVAGALATARGVVRSLRWWGLPGVLAAWVLLRGLVAANPAAGVEWAALLLGLTGVARMVVSAPEAERDRLMTGLFLAAVLVAGTGWYGVVARHEPFGLVDGGLWRAASTLTYANATAAFLVPITFLALGRLARDGADRIAAVAAFAGLVGTGATQSRAGLLGLAAGAVVLVLARGPRATVSGGWPVVVGAAVAVMGLLPSTMGWGPAHPEVAVPALLAGALLAVGARRIPARGWLVVALVGVVALPFTDVARKLEVATHFMAPGRISADSPDRGREWSATADLARRHLLTGVGPGNFAVSFAHDGRTYVAEFAHNEYLQTLAELGLVGAALVAAGAVVLTRALTRARRRADPATWSGAVAGLVALAVHSGLDFVWHVPVVPLVGALLVGLALAPISVPDHERGT